MNVHPSAGKILLGLPRAAFRTGSAVRTQALTPNGDALPILAYGWLLSFEGGEQTAIVRRMMVRSRVLVMRRVITDGAPVSWGARGGLQRPAIPALCRLARDPFFCDVEGAKNNFQSQATISSPDKSVQHRS